MTYVVLTQLLPAGKTPPATSSQHAGPSTPRSLQGSSSTTASGTSSHAGPRGTKRKTSSDEEDEECTIEQSDRQKRARTDADPAGSAVSAEWDASTNDDAFTVQPGPTDMDTEFWDAFFASVAGPEWTQTIPQNDMVEIPPLSETDPPSPTFFDVEEDESEDDDSDEYEEVELDIDSLRPRKKERSIWQEACKIRVEFVAEEFRAGAICKAVERQARPFLTSAPAWLKHCSHYKGKGKVTGPGMHEGSLNVPVAPIVELPRLSWIPVHDLCDPAPIQKGTPPRVRREARGSLLKNPLTRKAYH